MEIIMQNDIRYAKSINIFQTNSNKSSDNNTNVQRRQNTMMLKEIDLCRK